MSAALRYARAHPAIALHVQPGGVSRVHLPDPQSRERFISAVATARCDAHEELELLGEPVGRLSGKQRERLLRRVGVLSPSIALIDSLNAWENISLPAAYHGSPPPQQVAQVTQQVLEAFVSDPVALLARLPDQLSTLQRHLVAFVRLLVAGPELALIEGIEEGLSREECACVARFEAQYRARHPSGTFVYVDAREEQP